MSSTRPAVRPALVKALSSGRGGRPVAFELPAGHGSEGWRAAAACRDMGPEMFFPAGTAKQVGEEAERAKAVCATCPVCSACLQFALSTDQEFGVWGGRDERERRGLRKRWLAAEGN